MSKAHSYQIGFLGGGQMASALAAGAIKAHLLHEKDIVFYDPSMEAQARLRNSFPESLIVNHTQDLFANSQCIVLAVKPQVLLKIGGELSPLVQNHHLIISVVAGVSLKKLEALLSSGRIIRVMPNTPCQIQLGASGVAASKGTSTEDRNWAEKLMTSVGIVEHVEDELLHAVTGVSGSGPAYAFMMIDALADGGVAMGLPRKMAIRLAAQTLMGAAGMVLKTGEHPGELKDRVASPAGTTMAAVEQLEHHGLRSALISAVRAATQRSRELGGE